MVTIAFKGIIGYKGMHSPETSSSPLNNRGWKTILSFWENVSFRNYVTFREGTFPKMYLFFHLFFPGSQNQGIVGCTPTNVPTMGNPYISPISRGYLWVFSSPRIPNRWVSNKYHWYIHVRERGYSRPCPLTETMGVTWAPVILGRFSLFRRNPAASRRFHLSGSHEFHAASWW